MKLNASTIGIVPVLFFFWKKTLITWSDLYGTILQSPSTAFLKCDLFNELKKKRPEKNQSFVGALGFMGSPG